MGGFWVGVLSLLSPVVAIRPFGPFADRNGFMRRRWRRGVLVFFIIWKGAYMSEFSDSLHIFDEIIETTRSKIEVLKITAIIIGTNGTPLLAYHIQVYRRWF
jgi:hypothetical protein